MAIILITGGTGLVGKALSDKLIKAGHEIRFLSRNPKPIINIKTFFWDVNKQEMDANALVGVDHIIHLAGAGIAEKRWTKQRKEEIISSRVDSVKLIAQHLKEKNVRLKSFVGASAIGIYGMETSDVIYTETDKGTSDFLAETCEQWEKAYDNVRLYTERIAIIRISMVLSKQGGALKKLVPLFRLGLGSAIGSGKQYMPWIHITDLVSIFQESLFKPNYNGIYNATATEHITNLVFSNQLAKSLSKPFFIPAIPAFVLKLVYGEMASILLTGSRVSNKKIIDNGFNFQYPSIQETLKEINS